MKNDEIEKIEVELLVDALDQRNAVQDTARAEHLEGMQRDHPATQADQVQRHLGVEPLAHLPGRRGRMMAHSVSYTHLTLPTIHSV